MDGAIETVESILSKVGKPGRVGKGDKDVELEGVIEGVWKGENEFKEAFLADGEIDRSDPAKGGGRAVSGGTVNGWTTRPATSDTRFVSRRWVNLRVFASMTGDSGSETSSVGAGGSASDRA